MYLFVYDTRDFPSDRTFIIPEELSISIEGLTFIDDSSSSNDSTFHAIIVVEPTSVSGSPMPVSWKSDCPSQIVIDFTSNSEFNVSSSSSWISRPYESEIVISGFGTYAMVFDAWLELMSVKYTTKEYWEVLDFTSETIPSDEIVTFWESTSTVQGLVGCGSLLDKNRILWLSVI